MDLFTSDTFEKGGWATELYNQYLKDTPLSDLKGWTCNWKMWRGTYQRWLQYQPITGQFFWHSKPAIASTREALYAGYYVERGLPDNVAALHRIPEMEVIKPHWHWWPFMDFLIAEPQTLYSTLAKFPAERRCVWVCDSEPHPDVTVSNLGTPFRISSVPDLDAVKDHIGRVRHDHWIDLIAGIQYTKDECMNKNKWPSLVQGITNSLEPAAHLVDQCIKRAASQSRPTTTLGSSPTSRVS